MRTALTVQARAGLVYVFVPPLPNAEDWLSLLAAIERTAAATATPVVLEGYKAPYDRRLVSFSVTPDPGVIEVNIHPATGWDDLVGRTVQLYEEARQCGLRAEKFMVDGRHVGTGGGQPRGDGRGHAGGQPVPAPPGPAALAAGVLAQPSQPVPTCSAACSSGP